MAVIWQRLQADPLAADLIDFGSRYWWVGLIIVAALVLWPRSKS
jgi:hypothetical protein